MARLDALWTMVREIPAGRCACYSDLGAALPNPASGLFVGRWMTQAPDGIPWWRVVAKDGRLPIAKRGVYLSMEQRQLLEREGVAFVGEKVDMDAHLWIP